MLSTPRPFVKVVGAIRVVQKRGMPMRLVDGKWQDREKERALHGQHELNKTEHRNAVIGCGTCGNVIWGRPSLFGRHNLVFCGHWRGEVEGPVNEGVLMCQTHPFLECCKLMAIGIVDRSIGWTDKMSFCCGEWWQKFTICMILKPEALINCIEPRVRGVTDVEFYQEPSILEAWWIQQHRFLEGDSDKSPFSSLICANLIWNKE